MTLAYVPPLTLLVLIVGGAASGVVMAACVEALAEHMGRA